MVASTGALFRWESEQAVVRVLASALFAVGVLGRAGTTTAVTVVPITTADIVAIVAESITLPLCCLTFTNARTVGFVVRVQAQTLVTVGQKGIVIAAIASIPVATANVVVVIAVL